MYSRAAPPIPVITTSCLTFAQVLLADHVMIVAEGVGKPATPPLFTAHQCLLQKQEAPEEVDLLLKMVGG